MMEEDEDYPKTIFLSDAVKNSKIKIQWADDSFCIASRFGAKSCTKSDSVSLLNKENLLDEMKTEESNTLPNEQNSLLEIENIELNTNSANKYEKATEGHFGDSHDDMFEVLPNQKLESRTDQKIPNENEDLNSNKNREKGDETGEKCEQSKDNVNNVRMKVETSEDNMNNVPTKVETPEDNLNNGPMKVETSEDNVNNVPMKMETSEDNVNNGPLKVETSEDNANDLPLKVETSEDNANDVPLKVETLEDNVNNGPMKRDSSANGNNSNEACLPSSTNDKIFLPQNKTMKMMDGFMKSKSWVSILKKPNGGSMPLSTSAFVSTDSFNPPSSTVNERDEIFSAVHKNLKSLLTLTSQNQNSKHPYVSVQKSQIEECFEKQLNEPSMKGSLSRPLSSTSIEKKLPEEKNAYSVSLLNQTSLSKSNACVHKSWKSGNDFTTKHSNSKTLISLLNGKTFPMNISYEKANKEENCKDTLVCKLSQATVDSDSFMKRKNDREYSVRKATKKRKTISHADNAESCKKSYVTAFDDFKVEICHPGLENSWESVITNEGNTSELNTTYHGSNEESDFQKCESREIKKDFPIKQEVFDPEFGDVPLNAEFTASKSPHAYAIKEEVYDPECCNEQLCNEVSNINCNQSINDLKGSSTSLIKQEMIDPEYDDVPPVLSPRKEEEDQDVDEWNEECEESPPVLQKEYSPSKEDSACQQILPKRLSKFGKSKQNVHEMITGNLTCPICESTFQRVEDFEVHKALHSGKQIISDKQLGEKFVIKPANLKISVKCDNNNRKFKCEFCGKAFNRPSNLKEHMRIHTGMYPYRCQICGRGFHTRSRFLTHMLRHGDEEEKLNVLEPGNKAQENPMGEKAEPQDSSDINAETTGASLNDDESDNEGINISLPHISTQEAFEPKQEFSKASPSKIYVCNICGKYFGKVTQYRIHRMEHRGETPHSCNICNKIFPCKSDLTRHEATHSDERPHVCILCGKAFKRRNALVEHMTIHNREDSGKSGENVSIESIVKSLEPDIKNIIKDSVELEATETQKSLYTNDGQKIANSKFYCKECQVSFSARREYSMHRFQHNGGQPHLCAICNKRFVYKSDYDRHVVIHTGRKPYACHLCDSQFSRKYYLQRHLSKHKNTRIRLGEKSKEDNKLDIEIDNAEKSDGGVSDSDSSLNGMAGKLETSYDENGAMFLFVTDD